MAERSYDDVKHDHRLAEVALSFREMARTIERKMFNFGPLSNRQRSLRASTRESCGVATLPVGVAR